MPKTDRGMGRVSEECSGPLRQSWGWSLLKDLNGRERPEGFQSHGGRVVRSTACCLESDGL